MSATPFDWDDVRVFLAVLRTGSARKAASALNVSRPTVTRRLAELEQRMGLRLFDRATDGLHATSAATTLLPAAEDAERAMLAVARTAQAADHQMRGPIRVAMPAVVAADLLMDDLVAFCRTWPEIDLQLDGAYGVSDLAGREADVAIRFMPLGVAPEGDLAGRKVASAWMAIYGDADCFIGTRGGDFDRNWARKTPWPDLPIRGRIVNGEMLRSACERGMGMARLPCFFAEPRLERRTEPEPGLDVWVLVHSDLRRNPRLRAFRDAMVAGIVRQKDRLEGLISDDPGPVPA